MLIAPFIVLKLAWQVRFCALFRAVFRAVTKTGIAIAQAIMSGINNDAQTIRMMPHTGNFFLGGIPAGGTFDWPMGLPHRGQKLPPPRFSPQLEQSAIIPPNLFRR
ncbi:MAG: hypothetical protein CVT63_03100 [Candidatus Anoxymicrobium japonicum]|uniref:Uncharacterized protein n=1 Tax=Candidatus Anoxymicrobium japonicum TaxID=2013648 RepID=A0A2N3G6W0_9ACTN|nr:MAG: hypothetical protein CVT63_03100 [Candidatus Anoxymicrobium japonicum]